MTEEQKMLYSILEEVISNCKSNWISLSGGLDSSIISHFIKNRNPNSLAIITKDFLGADLTYSQIISKHLNIPLEICYVSTAQILDGIKNTIKILKNFNDIEIRNAVVMYLSLEELYKKNVKTVLTGDGADEIFAGYNFLLDKPKDEINDELKRIKKIMHFSSQEIAKTFGIEVESPFLNNRVIDFADSISVSMKVNNKHEKVFGKWILRKTFETHLPKSIIWREKSPMQDGAGTVGLTKLFESIISDEIFSKKIEKIKKDDGVTIRSKESLHYYEIFREKFDPPMRTNSNQNVCNDCGSEIKKNAKFCRMCGRFPI
jgi:asparagine synthase (glutamine-hydrolysing)